MERLERFLVPVVLILCTLATTIIVVTWAWNWQGLYPP